MQWFGSYETKTTSIQFRPRFRHQTSVTLNYKSTRSTLQNATNKISLSVIVFLHIASLVKTDFMNRKYRMMITYLCISSTVVSHFRTNKTMILTTPFSSLLFSFSFARKTKGYRLIDNMQKIGKSGFSSVFFDQKQFTFIHGN